MPSSAARRVAIASSVAKRIEEVTGRAATTVHRLLDARPMDSGGFVFARDEDDPVPYDLVVADEVSMCDTRLAASLVRAIEDGAHLVLVGDPDQLPSVGPGDVLRDVLASEAFVHTALTEVHRQAKGSRIVTLAQEVNAVPGVGPAVAKEILFSARRYKAPEALQMGFVNRIYPKADLVTEVTQIAETIAGNAPLSVKTAKATVNHYLAGPVPYDVSSCDAMVDRCSDSDDYAEGRRAFAEKRPPVFKGR